MMLRFWKECWRVKNRELRLELLEMIYVPRVLESQVVYMQTRRRL